MFKHILIPLDGSALAESALPTALTLAGSLNARLTLLRIPQTVETMLPALAGNYGTLIAAEEARAEREAHNYLDTLRNRYAKPDLPIEIAIAHGDVASAILNCAEQHHHDLIVMATHGYTGFTRFMLGSITEKVIPHAPCPVFIVRDKRPPQTILVPLDGSPRAEAALGPALSLARHFNSRLLLAHAIEPIDDISRGILEEIESGMGRSLQTRLEAEAQSYLANLRDQHRATVPHIDTVVTIGPAAVALLELTREHNIDLIAIATHGRTGLSRWLYGSVTEKVLRHVTCSLLVIRTAERK